MGSANERRDRKRFQEMKVDPENREINRRKSLSRL